MTAARISRDWEGETVAIFASGPSMSPAIAEQYRGVCRTIAINMQAIDCAPWADVIWATDFKFWREHGAQLLPLPGRKFHVLQGQTFPGVETLRPSKEVFDWRPEMISTGANSGYAALCLAAKLGAARVLLHGYDMRMVDGRARRFEYCANLNSKPKFSSWLANFERLAPELAKRNVYVINCTPGSALKCFRFEAQEGVRHVA
jgi:hypothetical protein